MRVNSIPDCCAGYLFTGFGYTRTAASGATRHDLDVVNKWLDNEERRWGHDAFAQIILNGTQRKYYKKLLKDRGYRCVIANIYHPGHGTRIFIYIKRFNNR